MSEQERKGVLAGLACYVVWGLCPLYWKLLGEANSFEVIAQRIIWCFVLMVVICKVLHLDFVALLKDKRALKHLVPAALLITVNWSVYIYAVDAGHVVDTALGYYINPLVSILLGIVLFKEQLTRLQVVAVGFCAAGIIYFVVDYGQLPWIALVLAFSFGLYGSVKKKGGYPPVQALAVENCIALPIAIGIATTTALVTGSHAFLGDIASAHGWLITLLLVGAGPVTAVPLVLFAKAANNVPLSLLGFIQYVSPTIALLMGVFLFGEAFTFAHVVCFGCIWIGLLLVSIDSLRANLAPATEL